MTPADIGASILSQYRSALAMIGTAIESCPEDLWNHEGDVNRFWHIAYHALFYTNLYLAPSEIQMQPWEKMRMGYNFLGPYPWPPHARPEIGTPYTREEIVEYHRFVSGLVAPLVAAVPMNAPSGFPWIPMNRFELHLYTIRHLAHHAGQLIDRLRERAQLSINWVGMQSEASVSD
ncbi:MAG: DinB family protein [Bacteroidetes bacterium]|nr:DinB family protein [Bacteroidota bacterium]